MEREIADRFDARNSKSMSVELLQLSAHMVDSWWDYGW